MVMEAETEDAGALGQWTGPFRIRDYLCHVVRDHRARPPDSPGLYLLSQRSWQRSPAGRTDVLYVGRAMYLRYRVGQFLSDLLGFTSDDPAEEEAYQHRGGHQMWHRYCVGRRIEPADLYLAWCALAQCLDCAEAKLLESLPTKWKPSTLRTCSHHQAAPDLPTSSLVPVIARTCLSAKNGRRS